MRKPCCILTKIHRAPPSTRLFLWIPPTYGESSRSRGVPLNISWTSTSSIWLTPARISTTYRLPHPKVSYRPHRVPFYASYLPLTRRITTEISTEIRSDRNRNEIRMKIARDTVIRDLLAMETVLAHAKNFWRLQKPNLSPKAASWQVSFSSLTQ